MLVQIISPYSPVKPEVKASKELSSKLQQERYDLTEAYCAKLLRQGVHAISPIVSNHYLAMSQKVPSDFLFWQEYCFALMNKVDEVHVLCLKGWEDSIGVKAEINYAFKIGATIKFVSSEGEPLSQRLYFKYFEKALSTS